MSNPKIRFWDDERQFGHRIIVTLAFGWAFRDNDKDDAALHVTGFDKPQDAKSAIKAARPCSCWRCRTHAGERQDDANVSPR